MIHRFAGGSVINKKALWLIGLLSFVVLGYTTAKRINVFESRNISSEMENTPWIEVSDQFVVS